MGGKVLSEGCVVEEEMYKADGRDHEQTRGLASGAFWKYLHARRRNLQTLDNDQEDSCEVQAELLARHARTSRLRLRGPILSGYARLRSI